MQDAATAADVPVVAVGFSSADALRSVAGHLSWRGPFLSDEQRSLYGTFGLERAPWWRVYSPGTLAIYARGWRRRQQPDATPAEDTRQLGGDAVIRDGTAEVLWIPCSPDDRVTPTEMADIARCVRDEAGGAIRRLDATDGDAAPERRPARLQSSEIRPDPEPRRGEGPGR